MNRFVATLVGLSIMFISLGSSSASAAKGDPFTSKGTYTLEVPKLGFTLSCSESGSGKVEVSAELKMTACKVKGFGECTVTPFVLHLDEKYISSLFIMTTTGEGCFWFEKVDWIPVDFEVTSFKEEKGIANVQLVGATSFMQYSASMSIASTWTLGK